MEALGSHAAKSERIYHADSCNLPCIQTLYKLTFDLGMHLLCQNNFEKNNFENNQLQNELMEQ